MGPELRARSQQGRLWSPELRDVFSEGCSLRVLRKKAPFGSPSGAPPCPSRAGQDGASAVHLALSRGTVSLQAWNALREVVLSPVFARAWAVTRNTPSAGPFSCAWLRRGRQGTGGRRGPAEAVDGPQHLERCSWGEHRQRVRHTRSQSFARFGSSRPAVALLLPRCPPGCAQVCSVQCPHCSVLSSERGAKPVTSFVKNLSALSDWYSVYTSAIAFTVRAPGRWGVLLQASGPPARPVPTVSLGTHAP